MTPRLIKEALIELQKAEYAVEAASIRFHEAYEHLTLTYEKEREKSAEISH